jgi:hypothetical protein
MTDENLEQHDHNDTEQNAEGHIEPVSDSQPGLSPSFGDHEIVSESPETAPEDAEDSPAGQHESSSVMVSETSDEDAQRQDGLQADPDADTDEQDDEQPERKPSLNAPGQLLAPDQPRAVAPDGLVICPACQYQFTPDAPIL